MKINVLLLMIPLLLFTHCKKKDVIVEKDIEKEDEVEISFELSLTDSKTYFGDILGTGAITWWNDYNEEYLYMTVEYTDVDDNNLPVTRALLKQIRIELYRPTESYHFKGTMPRKYFSDGSRHTLYYFGNNGNGRENSNVENIYDEVTGEVIGKTVSFDKQDGSINRLGDCHIASQTLISEAFMNSDGVVVNYTLEPQGPLKSRMSIALLDLSGETELSGSATSNSVFEVKWNGKAFEERIYSNNTGFDVKDNVGNWSYISLLPNDDVVDLECEKGSYIFESGIGEGNLYIGKNSDGKPRPLVWRNP